MIVAFPGKNRNVWSVGSRNFFLFFFYFSIFPPEKNRVGPVIL